MKLFNSASLCAVFVILQSLFSSLGASQLVENLQAGKNQILVAYGTSLTEKSVWPARIEEWLNSRGFAGKLTLLNKGVSGSTTVSHGIKNFDRDVMAPRPDAVIIEFGMNDCIRRLADPSANPPRLEEAPHPVVPLEKFKANLLTMVDRLHAELPDTEVFLMTMNPAFDSTATPNSGKYRAALGDYYGVVKEVAAEKSVQLIDVYPKWLETFQKDPTAQAKLIPDGVHPVPAGSDAVTVPAIQEALTK